MSINLERYSSQFRYLFLIFLYFVVCLTVLNTFMDRVGFRGDSPRYGFSRMMNFTAEKPFCYRVLTPLIVNSIYDLFPDDLIGRIESDLTEKSGLLRYMQTAKNFDAELSAKYHLTYFYMFISLMIMIFFLRKLTMILYDSRALHIDLTPAVAMLFVPLIFLHGGYMYDFPEIMFFVMGLVFLLKKNRVGYYIVLPLAVLNKGTGIFLILYFIIINFDNRKSRNFWIHLIVQSLIAGFIIVAVRMMLAGNPDPSVSFRLWTNLKFWLNPGSYVKFHEIYAPLIGVPTGANIIFLVFAIYLIMYRWKEKRRLIKRLILWPFLAMIPIFLYFGNRDEIRSLTPVFPGLYLLGFSTITMLYRKFNNKGPEPEKP